MRHGGTDLNHGLSSFLDVVTNMVGILIILVMVLATRLKNAPINVAKDARLDAVAAELQSRQAAEQSMRGDVLRLARQINALRQDVQAKKAQRATLSILVAACEKKIAQRRENSATPPGRSLIRSGTSAKPGCNGLGSRGRSTRRRPRPRRCRSSVIRPSAGRSTAMSCTFTSGAG